MLDLLRAIRWRATQDGRGLDMSSGNSQRSMHEGTTILDRDYHGTTATDMAFTNGDPLVKR
jgi:hypothetical protein